MIALLRLFWLFFQIGVFTFGGGYAMIPMIKQQTVARGYIELDLLIDFIAISESTPGPFAINVATFIGNHAYGVPGAIFATLGVVLPSFIIILSLASLGVGIINSRGFKRALLGMKPAVVGLIFAAALSITHRVLWPSFSLWDINVREVDLKGVLIFIVVAIALRLYKKMPPVLLIVLSAFLGIIIYSI